MTKKGITRRDFITTATGAAVVGVAGTTACRRLQPVDVPDDGTKTREPPASPTKSKVVLIRDQQVLNQDRGLNAEVLEKMLDQGVAALFDTDAESAWKKVLAPKDVLGIKTNVWRFLRTPRELEQALVARATRVGIQESDIACEDRNVRSNPVFQRATALINVRPLRTHHWSGVGSLIKNYIMFSAVPFSWHVDSCANLAGVWELENCKGKTRLNILVMLTPLFYGKGPHHYQAQYTWEYKGLLIGTDPVAVDATGVRILEAKRKQHFGKDEPMYVPPKHIAVAQQKYSLGFADPAMIDVIKLGWMDESFI